MDGYKGMLYRNTLPSLEEMGEDAYNGVAFNRRLSQDADESLPPPPSILEDMSEESMSPTWPMMNSSAAQSDQRAYTSDNSSGSSYVNPSANRSASTDLPNPEALPESPQSTGKRSTVTCQKEKTEPPNKMQKLQKELQFPSADIAALPELHEEKPRVPEIIYREYLTTNGSLSSEPLPVRIKFSDRGDAVLGNVADLKTKINVSLFKWGLDDKVYYMDPNDRTIKTCIPHIKQCNLKETSTGETYLQVDIVRKGQLTDPSKSLPLSRSHGNFLFYFRIDIPEAAEAAVSNVFEVRSKETRSTRQNQ